MYMETAGVKPLFTINVDNSIFTSVLYNIFKSTKCHFKCYLNKALLGASIYFVKSTLITIKYGKEIILIITLHFFIEGNGGCL